jgi:hypothetical protein
MSLTFVREQLQPYHSLLSLSTLNPYSDMEQQAITPSLETLVEGLSIGTTDDASPELECPATSRTDLLTDSAAGENVHVADSDLVTSGTASTQITARVYTHAQTKFERYGRLRDLTSDDELLGEIVDSDQYT